MRRILFLAPLLLAVSACDLASSGAEAGEAVKRDLPVTTALEAYHTARGTYPDSLGMLSPEYLPDSVLHQPDGAPDPYPLRYRRTHSSYELSFRYRGGRGECVYSPPIGQWECQE